MGDARRINSQLTDVKCQSHLETLFIAMRVACCQLSILHLGETDAWGSFSNGYCWQWSMTSSSRVGCGCWSAVLMEQQQLAAGPELPD